MTVIRRRLPPVVEVPWGVVQYGGVALAVLVPILFFPFSGVLWLTWDFMFRPNRD